MSIVSGLFRMVAPSLVDNLEAQGVFKAVDRVSPNLVPEMFIGKEGISNLGKAGVPETEALSNNLDLAQKDWFKLQPEEWNKKWADAGFAYDPVANKAMMEISDQNINLKSGVNLNKLPSSEIMGFTEIFNAETLKKAYPEVADIKVGFLDDARSPRLAGFNPTDNVVYFNREHPTWDQADAKSIVLHEIQHYVQGKELFTQGEGFTNVLQQNAVFQDSTQALDKLVATSVPDAMKFAKQNAKLGFTTDNVTNALGSLTKRDGVSAEQSLASAFRDKDMARKFINAASNTPKLADVIAAKTQASQAYSQSISEYMKVAGEVFARQTQQRADMSAADRLAQPAMRAIETNPTNQQYGINIDNMTAPSAVPPTGVAPTQAAFADPFAMQIPQSTIPQGL